MGGYERNTLCERRRRETTRPDPRPQHVHVHVHAHVKCACTRLYVYEPFGTAQNTAASSCSGDAAGTTSHEPPLLIPRKNLLLVVQMTRIDRMHRPDALCARDSLSSRVRCPEAVA